MLDIDRTSLRLRADQAILAVHPAGAQPVFPAARYDADPVRRRIRYDGRMWCPCGVGRGWCRTDAPGQEEVDAAVPPLATITVRTFAWS